MSPKWNLIRLRIKKGKLVPTSFISGDDITRLSKEIEAKINRNFYGSDKFCGVETEAVRISRALVGLNHYMDAGAVEARIAINSAMQIFVRSTVFYDDQLSGKLQGKIVIPSDDWKPMVRQIGQLVIPCIDELIGDQDEDGLLSYALIASSVHYMNLFHHISDVKDSILQTLELYRQDLKAGSL